MQKKTFQSLSYYQFDGWEHADAVHGLFTRLGGHSLPPWASLNTGHTVGDDLQAVAANHQSICQALDIQLDQIVSPHQVHSAKTAVVGKPDTGHVIPETDALITQVRGVFLMLRFADCVPVMLFDPVQGAVGLAHAGWRGTVAGIAGTVVLDMQAAFGCRPADIVAGIGPSIGPCCYEVGADVAEVVQRAFPEWSDLLQPRANGHWHLDLWEANRRQLLQAGVRAVQVAEMCTACCTKEWFSHRAERGKTGRWGALIGLRERMA
jgi:YfiH family protein